MYLVTKRIDFCYGHRLLDYDGVCKHPHGHNALVEVDVRTDRLDTRNMVADFSDIKRLVKGWIDRELDHKMILRHDDPLVGPLEALGEPIYKLESNPTVERIAKLIFDKSREQGLRRTRRESVGNAELVCRIQAGPILIFSPFRSFTLSTKLDQNPPDRVHHNKRFIQLHPMPAVPGDDDLATRREIRQPLVIAAVSGPSARA